MPQGERETAAFRLPESEAVMNGNLFVRVLRRARESSTACASINILNYNTARAVIHAAERAGRPVILQPSVGTVRRYGVSEMFRMIDGLRSAASVPVALHLDHCRDEELARACADAGWDAVMMDYSALPLHLYGQVCLPFSLAWWVLCFAFIPVFDWLRWAVIGGEKPKYYI